MTFRPKTNFCSKLTMTCGDIFCGGPNVIYDNARAKLRNCWNYIVWDLTPFSTKQVEFIKLTTDYLFMCCISLWVSWCITFITVDISPARCWVLVFSSPSTISKGNDEGAALMSSNHMSVKVQFVLTAASPTSVDCPLLAILHPVEWMFGFVLFLLILAGFYLKKA